MKKSPWIYWCIGLYAITSDPLPWSALLSRLATCLHIMNFGCCTQSTIICIRFLTEDDITITDVYTLMDLQLCKLIRARIYLAKSWVLEMAEPNFNFEQDFDKKITGGFIFLALPQALSKTLMEEDLVYLRAQFLLLEPNKNGRVTFENFRMVHFQTCHFPSLFFPFQELLSKQLQGFFSES